MTDWFMTSSLNMLYLPPQSLSMSTADVSRTVLKYISDSLQMFHYLIRHKLIGYIVYTSLQWISTFAAIDIVVVIGVVGYLGYQPAIPKVHYSESPLRPPNERSELWRGVLGAKPQD